jgi:hypothetical protein
MRFAAAALMAGLLFLVGAIAGFGGSAPSPRDFPEAIRLSGVGIQAPTELPTAIPDSGTSPAAAGSQVPAVAVGHNIVPVPLIPAASPAPTARRQPTATPTSKLGPPTEPVPASGITLLPLPPIITTTISPVPPIPAPTPNPSSTRRGALRSLLGLN